MKLEKGTFGTFPAALAKGRHPIQQALLSWLWFHKNAEGVCYPSLKTLAEESGLGKKPDRNEEGKCEACGKIDERCECARTGGVTSVKDHLAKLEKAGLIVRTRRQKPGKRENDSTLYGVQIFPLPESVTEWLEEGEEVGRHAANGVGQEAAEVGRHAANGVGRHAASNQIHLEPNPGTTLVAGSDEEEIKDGSCKMGSPEYELAEFLFRCIRENNRTYRPDIKSERDVDELLDQWAETMDLVLTKDGRDPREVRLLIDWCQHDDFWKTNILSPKKFRKQYDQLRIKAGTALKKSIVPSFKTV